MNLNLLAVFIILAILALMATVFFHRRKKDHVVLPVPTQTEHASSLTGNNESEVGCDLAIFNENGIKILESREIQTIPARAYRVESSDSAINRVKHIAADLFKGAVSIPNKTVEVIFKPEIQQGLADGTYTLMRTNSGEVLADAVNSSGAIVGKGRIIQGGKARQLASGAFQLVSIAVAQSHLADIERSLSAIKDSISEILERQENEDKARISGAFDYLREIATYMKEFKCPDELSQQKRNAIEGIVKDSYSWRNKLEEDMSSLIKQISNLKDLDTFGTGETFEKLKGLIEKVDPLLKRRELFLNLASATNFVTTYLDPAKREFSRVNTENDKWSELIENFKDVVWEKQSTLMGKALFNSNETLQLRRDKLKSLSSEYRQLAIEQKNSYVYSQDSLEKSVSRLIGPSGNVHVAISFDDRGDVNGAAIL